MIYDRNGDEIADIPLSEHALAKLRDDGADIVVLYHTPRMLQGSMEIRSGSFSLRRVGGRLVSDHPGAVRDYANMQKAFAAWRKRGQPDDPE